MLDQLVHYRNRLNVDGVHLGVYEWFIFWVAFYFKNVRKVAPLRNTSSPTGTSTWAQAATHRITERVGTLMPGHQTPIRAENELLLTHLNYLLPGLAENSSNKIEMVLSILLDFWLSDEDLHLERNSGPEAGLGRAGSLGSDTLSSSSYGAVGNGTTSTALYDRYSPGDQRRQAGALSPAIRPSMANNSSSYSPPSECLVSGLTLLVRLLLSPSSPASTKPAAKVADGNLGAGSGAAAWGAFPNSPLRTQGFTSPLSRAVPQVLICV